MEMGRPEAALKELQAASLNRRRRLDCLILQAICRRDNGEEVAAEELLQKGRRVAGLTPQERNTVTYELAALYERRGAVEQAIPLYREVTEADPAFRDAAERLCSLAGAEPPEIIELDLEES